MNDARINALRDYIVSHSHHALRQTGCVPEINYRDTPDLRLRAARRLSAHLSAEKPVILEGENIVFTRTLPSFPDILTDSERDGIFSSHYKHEQGYVCNICPDYSLLLSRGLDDVIDEYRGDEATVTALKAILDLAGRYREEAVRLGREDIAKTLDTVPAKPAVTFREALQFLRIIHFALWCEGEYHVIFGRFDQLMMPYLRHDLDAGLLDIDYATELVCDFFISCNKDSDLYPGMQQGDNGQSMVLGGYDEAGNDMYNVLSEIAIEASLKLKVIDPKINLRVSSKTPFERYRFATRLTAAGLGFPQYSNDDTVALGLIALGYSPADAYNYVVAACWEFIIPGVGMDIPNIDALSFAGCVDRTIRNRLGGCSCFEEFKAAALSEVAAEAKALTTAHGNVWMRPAPLMSLMFSEKKTNDISDGAKYNNYGIHGTGVASAADSICAVKRLVFDDGTLTAEKLIEVLDADYEGYPEIYNTVRSDPHKMGNDDELADGIACALLSTFADSLNGIKNDRGGIWRAGTGSAMYYVFHASEIGAGADGRKKGGFLPANYSPSLGLKLNGPLSIVMSFTKPELSKVINGGPLTLEFASSAIRDQSGIDKIALLVRTFINRGGHQLQLNVINRSSLLDAQAHPENYRNLVVRVWGWSGYFTELDKCYQEQILSRAELTL